MEINKYTKSHVCNFRKNEKTLDIMFITGRVQFPRECKHFRINVNKRSNQHELQSEKHYVLLQDKVQSVPKRVRVSSEKRPAFGILVKDVVQLIRKNFRIKRDRLNIYDDNGVMLKLTDRVEKARTYIVRRAPR